MPEPCLGCVPAALSVATHRSVLLAATIVERAAMASRAMHECKRLYIEGDVRYSTLRAHKTSGAPSLSANTPHAEERRAPLILLVTRDALAADLWLARAERVPHVASGASVAPVAAALVALAPPKWRHVRASGADNGPRVSGTI